MKNLFQYVLIFAFTFSAALAHAVPNSITLQTKILKPDGTALTAPSVNFQFTTLDPLGTCALYVESFAGLSMVSSNGVVITNLGSGVQVYSAAGAYGNVFNNQTVSYSCQAGGTYTPAATDRRKIVMQFNDGSGWQTVQALDINSVPFSNYAGDSAKFSGHALSDFPLATAFPDCATTGKVLTYNGSAFTCVTALGGGAGTVTNVTSANSYISIATGTSTPVITANVGTASNTLAAGNDTRITGAAQKANNLSDLASATTARTNLGLGTAAVLNSGTAATNLVQLDSGAKIPTALIPNLPASQITSGVIATAQLGTGTADATTYLRGDGAWTVPTSALPASGGSATAPGYTFSGDTNTGLFSAGADTLGLSTGGTERLAVDSSGRVGVGRSPASNTKLAVQGAVVSTTNIMATGATVDLSLSNIHLLKSPGGSAITLQNMVDGGNYTVFVSDTAARTYTFTGCTNSYFNPANGPTTFRSSYTISVINDSGSVECYINWSTGFN